MTSANPDDADREQMRRLFDRAMGAGPTIAALDRLVYCSLLDRITGHDLNVALEEFSNDGAGEAAIRELEALDEEQRADLVQTIIPMWNEALSRAVMHMWHACRRLGYDPEGLGGDHLALVASMFLGELAETTNRD